MERLVPTKEQEEAIQKMVNEPTKAALNASELGTGKTLCSVEVALRIGAENILLICPLGTRVGWERTFKRQGFKHPIYRIDSTKAGKENMEKFHAKEPGVFIIGREYFRRFDWLRLKTDMIIYDEIHAVQNRNSAGFKKLFQTRNIKGYKLALSATPFRNNFQGAWAVTRWLWPDRVERSFWTWVTHWCSTEYDPFTMNRLRVSGERYPGKYVAQLPCYVRLINENVQEPVFQNRYVELTPAQRKQYRRMEEDAIVWLEQNPLVADLPITQRLRLRQMTLGTVTFAEDGSVDFEDNCRSAKLDAVKELIADHDGKAFVVVESAKFARVLANRIKGAKLWSGDVSQAEREEILRDIPDVLVATIASIGEGVDGLQRKHHVGIFVSEHEDNVLNQQVIGRLARTGQTEQVIWYRILATDTWDEGIFNNLQVNASEMRSALTAKK